MNRDSEIESIVRIRAILTQAGLRTTAARLAVIRQLEQAVSPVTHAEVAEKLVPFGFDKATVFRNLTDLVDVGLASRTELGDRVWRFELKNTADGHQGHHPHFVCVDCGKVTCLNDVEVPKSIEKSWAKVGKVTEVLLRGHCNACGK